MLAAEVCTHAQSPRRKEEEGKLPSYIVVLCHLLDVCQLWGKPLLPSSSSSPPSGPSLLGQLAPPPPEKEPLSTPPPPLLLHARFPSHTTGIRQRKTVVFSSSLDRPQGLNEHHTPSRCGKNGNNIIKRQNRDVPFGFAEVSPPFLLCLHFCVFRLSRAHVLAPSGISERGSPFAVRPPAAHPFAAPSA